MTNHGASTTAPRGTRGHFVSGEVIETAHLNEVQHLAAMGVMLALMSYCRDDLKLGRDDAISVAEEVMVTTSPMCSLRELIDACDTTARGMIPL